MNRGAMHQQKIIFLLDDLNSLRLGNPYIHVNQLTNRSSSLRLKKNLDCCSLYLWLLALAAIGLAHGRPQCLPDCRSESMCVGSLVRWNSSFGGLVLHKFLRVPGQPYGGFY